MKKIALAAAIVASISGCASYTSNIYGPIGDTAGKKVSVEAQGLNNPSDIEAAIKKLSDQCTSKEVVNFYSTRKFVNWYFFSTTQYYMAGNCKEGGSQQ